MAGISLNNGHRQVPRSVEEITKSAQEYAYDAEYPLRYWLRTAAALVKQAEVYRREGDDETTYFLLFRHAHLVLEYLPDHPGIREQALRPAWKEATNTAQKELEVLNSLRPKIKAKYERYQKHLQEKEARANAHQRRVSEDAAIHQDERHFEWQRTRQVNPHDNKELAARLAQREHTRRAATSSHSAPPADDDMQQRLHALRSRVESQTQVSTVHHPQQAQRQDSGYRYPSVPAHRTQQQYSQPYSSQGLPYQDHVLTQPPALPPKHDLSSLQGPMAPARPDKILDGVMQPPSRPDTPSDDRVFSSTSTLENGTALRTIFLPSTLRTTFLRVAQKNTASNLETCGFLVGTLMKNAFFVSKLVIPSQKATSDTCEMTNESQLFDYVDTNNLMVLGWIHTHPSQTCFMSSQDLHTHAGYQAMLAESVAVVCAPSKGDTLHGGEYGVFRLTDPPGHKMILTCNKPGVFHPHDIDASQLYVGALRPELKPGHVVEMEDMPFDVVDLR